MRFYTHATLWVAFTLMFLACPPPPAGGNDAGEDAGHDGGGDAGADAGTDAGVDAGDDAGSDLPEEVTIGGHAVYAHFTNPPAMAGYDNEIIAETLRLIDATPAGETIQAAIHSLVLGDVAAALIRAQDERGVTVEVVEDGSDEFDADETPRELAAALGVNHVFCGTRLPEPGNRGCITKHVSGIMHTKLMTFSTTTDPKGNLQSFVTWFGSANMTHATGAKTFNNTITIYGDEELYTRASTYFGQLKSQVAYTDNDYYDASLPDRGYWLTESARAYVSPSQNGDLVEGRLAYINPDADCEIRVSQSMMYESRRNLAVRLGVLKEAGCNVYVAVNTLHDAVKTDLAAANIPTWHSDTHDKLILVAARYNGSAEVRHLVFTGSHNWTISANTVNDELFVRLESQALYEQFVAHFNRMVEAGVPVIAE